METKRMLTVYEASQRIKISTDAIRRAIRKNSLPAEKYGGFYLVSPDDLDAYKARTGGNRGRPRGKKQDAAQEEGGES